MNARGKKKKEEEGRAGQGRSSAGLIRKGKKKRQQCRLRPHREGKKETGA